MPELFTGSDLSGTASAEPAAVASTETTPSPEPVTAAGSEPAATGPTDVVSDAPVGTDQAQTPAEPPQETWPRILANARTKAATDAKAQYAWAESIPEPHRATVGQFYTLLDREPTQAVEVLITTLANHPEQAPKLRSLLGRLLGTRPGPTGPAPAGPQRQAPVALPEPDFQDAAGHTFYSADRQRQVVEAIEARIEAKYAPILSTLHKDYRTRAEQIQAAESQRQADTWAEQRYAAVSKWPQFATHQAAIAQAMTEDPTLEIGDAYIQIVVPQLDTQARTQVVATLHDKARASAHNPATPATPAATRPTTFAEAFAQLPARVWQQ